MEKELVQGYQAPAEQIAEWKRKYGDVFEIEVEGYRAYVHSPSRKTLSYAASISKSDPMQFNEAILRGCWLEGDLEIQTEDSLFMGVSAQLDQIIKVAEATIKKL